MITYILLFFKNLGLIFGKVWFCVYFILIFGFKWLQSWKKKLPKDIKCTTIGTNVEFKIQLQKIHNTLNTAINIGGFVFSKLILKYI